MYAVGRLWVGKQFSNAEKLKDSWKTTKMQDDILLFFSILFNTNKNEFCYQYHSKDNFETENKNELSDKGNLKGCLFEMHCTWLNSNKKTRFHIINACEICERCKSKKLISSFNSSELYVIYMSINKKNVSLTKSCTKIARTVNHFDRTLLTLLAFGNFDFADRVTLVAKETLMTPQ